MASPVRWSVAGGVIALTAACAGLAGLEDPVPLQETDAEPPPDPPDSPPFRKDASAIAPDVARDATSDAPACSKQDNDGPCEAGSECCSEACAQTRKCTASCIKAKDACLAHKDCCVGLYCGTFQCVKCLVAGQPVDDYPGGDIPIAESCCSGQFDPFLKRCK
jgi:hypothetical protein